MFVVRCARWVAGVAAILGFCGAVAAAQPAASFNFDLDRMPLHDALQQYSSLTGRSVIYDSSRISGRYSSALRGSYSAGVALRRMIAGSGMEVRHETDKTVSLIVVPAETEARFAIVPSTAARTSRDRYYGLLQSQLRRLLCADPVLEAGSYRLLLRFRIAGQPPAMDVLHVVATDRPDLELRIQRTLQGQRLAAPPPGFGQPVTLLLTPENMPPGGGCAS